MPMQPPRFSFRKTPERRPWQPGLGVSVRRIRGRAGVRLRRQVLERDPLCVRCLAEGVTRASEIADHRVPLAEGGSNELTNFQGLCVPCHDEKTKGESTAGAAAARYRD